MNKLTPRYTLLPTFVVLALLLAPMGCAQSGADAARESSTRAASAGDRTLAFPGAEGYGKPSDRNRTGADGYTMLEKYLNGI